MVGVRRLLVAGFALLAVAALLLTRVPAGAHYASDLLPALILAGMAGGLSAPAIQIGALSGVPHSMTGLAGGLVETLREIGGGVGVAVVATVLVSRADNSAGAGDSTAHGVAAVNAFHAAFWVMFIVAVLGVLTAAIAFPRATTQHVEPAPTRSSDSIVPESDARV
jgi:MFS family permease